MRPKTQFALKNCIMYRIISPRVTLIATLFLVCQIAVATAPTMKSIVRVSDTQVNVYFSEAVQLGSYSSGFTLQDCQGFVYPIINVSDASLGDQVLELTTSDLVNAVGDIRLTYFNVDGPITDLQNNALATDGFGVADYSPDHFNVNNITYSGELFTPSENDEPASFAFNNDGSKLFILGLQNNNTIYEYDLATPFDITTNTYSGKSLDIELESFNPLHMTFDDSGSRLFVAEFTNALFLEYSLSTNFDLSTAVFSTAHASPSNNQPTCIGFSNDGLTFFVMDNADFIRQYPLPNPYDLTSLPSSAVVGITGFNTNLNIAISFTFNHNGTKL